jgi:hypothetical protein
LKHGLVNGSPAHLAHSGAVLSGSGIPGSRFYDRVNVPAEYTCDPPFIRLEGDFCGLPMSGVWLLRMLIAGSINIFIGLITDVTVSAESVRELLVILSAVLLLLPIISTLLLIWRGDRRGLQIFHLVGLCLAGGLMLWVLSAESGLRMIQLWGPWLYFASVIVLLILEIVVFAFKSRLKPVS